eukprot:5509157-Pleurochrysis_carterae.AAC.5
MQRLLHCVSVGTVHAQGMPPARGPLAGTSACCAWDPSARVAGLLATIRGARERQRVAGRDLLLRPRVWQNSDFDLAPNLSRQLAQARP